MPIRSLLPATLLSATLAAQHPGLSPETLFHHYTRVLTELRAADTSNLSPPQREERARLIRELDHYRQSRRFGVNHDFPGEFKPYFIDACGRRCAVAHLLDRSGMQALTLRVRRHANHAWVADLSDDAPFRAWLRRSGLTLVEAARIQMPGTRDVRQRVVEPNTFDPRILGSAPRPTDTSTPRSTTPTRRGTPGVARQTGGAAVAELPPQTWDVWWNFNRHEFLVPKARIPSKQIVKTRATQAAAQTPVRDSVAKDLEQFLGSSVADVRRAATVALGRVGGRRNVPALLRMLKDPSLEVRHSAILALGATGSSRAVLELLHIAKVGHARRAAEEISTYAQPLAVVALGLAERAGSRVDTAALVNGQTFQSDAAGRARLQFARLLYRVLAPNQGSTPLAHALVAAKDTPLDLRCRAIEVLPAGGDDKALRVLTRALNGHRLEARRSAALALGRMDHKLAPPALMLAAESGELLTRAFALLALGRHGKRGRAFLLHHMSGMSKSLRPWGALALGLSVRRAKDFGDAAVVRAIRKAWRKEKNRDAVGAYVVALGLSRDQTAVPELLDLMRDASSSITRASAAEALALIGKGAARRALRNRMHKDSCAFVRMACADILGVIGNPADLTSLLQAMREESHPVARGRLAMSIGMLDQTSGLRELRELLANPKLSGLDQAQLIEALGMTLSSRPVIELKDLFRQSNFVVFPGWFRGLSRLTL